MNEEAINTLKVILEEATETEDSICYVTSCDADALKAAIKALEQQPCEDCVGREDAINTAIEAVDEWDGGCNINRATMICKAIKNLPSVTPQPKRGKWIVNKQVGGKYQCSQCGMFSGLDRDDIKEGCKLPNYCSDCGAKMAESEDKE